jgi:hypothetical protein
VQSYTEFPGGQTLDTSRPLILANDKTIMSCNSGTAFPTTNLQVGMLCHRTDLQKLYILTALTPTWLEILNLAATTWNSANDGAGSGLDADLLDGLHASAFARLDGTGLTFTGMVNYGAGSQISFIGHNTPVIRFVPTGASTGNLYGRIQCGNDGNLYVGFLNDTELSFTRGLKVRPDGQLEALGRGIVWDSTNFDPSGTQATLGYTPLNKAGDSMTGLITTRATTGAMNVNTQGVEGIQVVGASGAGNAAYMTFHRPGSYAIRFGLDTDNVLKVGGWSLGNVAYTIWHSGNFTPSNYAPLSGAAFGGAISATTGTFSGGISATTMTATSAITAGTNEWFRSNGNVGWYNNTWGGGIYMEDATYVRTYGSKQFYCNNHITTAGNSYAADFIISSDAALKHSVRNILDPLAIIDQLHGVRFRYKSDNRPSIGFIAQELQSVLPELVHKNEAEGHLAVAYSQITAVLVEGIKALRQEIADLRASIA